MARTMSVPCRRDLACYRNDGHTGDHAYATPKTVPQPVTLAATPAPLDVRVAAIFAEHRECGKPNGYDGCYSHWPMLPHCRADGMALPCDVMQIAAACAEEADRE